MPEILLTIKQPTFVTVDHGFWDRRLCHPEYCILCFDLHLDQQTLLPRLLRRLLQVPGFRTRSERMGKLARVSTRVVEYWTFKARELRQMSWTDKPTER